MSINLYLSAKREVTVNKTGKISTQSVHFDLWQTPTEITKAAIRSNDPKAVYIEWVTSEFIDEKDPVGIDKEHLKSLEEFLTMCEDEGYEVEFYEM